jgi:hypothetical protein
MCGHGEHHGGYGYCFEREYSGWHGHGCCCAEAYAGHGPGRRFHRRFATRAERIAWLEEYLQDLQAEVKAVEEHIAKMKAAG